jgi:hypothetical protein
MSELQNDKLTRAFEAFGNRNSEKAFENLSINNDENDEETGQTSKILSKRAFERMGKRSETPIAHRLNSYKVVRRAFEALGKRNLKNNINFNKNMDNIKPFEFYGNILLA